MMNETDILNVSRVVDDSGSATHTGQEAPAHLTPAVRRHRRADEALRAAHSSTVIAAPRSLADRIEAELSAPEPIARIAPSTPDAGWRVWGGALAAAVALAGGVTLLAVRMHQATDQSPAPFATGAATVSPLTAALANLDARPDPVLRRIEDPLMTEAQLLRDDTRRAAETVLAQLPVRIAWR